MAIPNPTEPKPVASARAADNLGQGWKVRPFLRVNAGETAILMDVAGPGIIQHIWLVEGLNRGLVMRFYWDDEKTPSVVAPVPDFFAVGHGRFAPVNSLPVVVNPEQRSQLLLADAVSDAGPDHPLQRDSQGCRVGGLPDHLC